MSKAIGKTLIVVLLVGILAALVWGLTAEQNPFTTNARADNSAAPSELPSATVQKSTIESYVSGPGEIKGASNEKLEMKKNRYYKELLVGLNTRITKGTPLVKYTNGETLKAPYNLVVTETNLPKKAKQELTEEHYLQVTRVDSMNVDIAVGESDIANVHIGQEAEVTVGSDEKTTITGTVSAINEVGTYSSSGSKYTVTVSIPNEDGSILVGMSANLRIKTNEASDVLTVPVSAIKTSDAGTFVTIQHEDGTTEDKLVTTGVSDGTKVEVSGDIHEGERVLLNELPTASSSSASPASTSSASSSSAASSTSSTTSSSSSSTGAQSSSTTSAN